MKIHEYGEEHTKHLLFFQGSCEPWEEFSEAARLLGQAFSAQALAFLENKSNGSS